MSLYHRHGNPLFTDLLHRLGGDPAVQAVVLPRTPEQRVAIRESGLTSLIVPDRALDARSLVAFADLVISAGGTMNREAVALGTPVWTTFAGRLGAVDEGLIADGRLRLLTSVDEIVLAKRAPAAVPATRDPAILLDLMLASLGLGLLSPGGA